MQHARSLLRWVLLVVEVLGAAAAVGAGGRGAAGVVGHKVLWETRLRSWRMPRPLGGLHYIRCMHDRNRGWPLSRLHKTHTARRVPASLHTSHNDAAVESAPLALGRKGSAAGGRGQARDGWPHPLAGLRIHTTAASGRLSRLCALWHWRADRYRHCRTHCSQGNRSMLGARPQARRLGQAVKLRPPAEPGGRTVHRSSPQHGRRLHLLAAMQGATNQTWMPRFRGYLVGSH